ncbi:hypothetical protein [Craterilacuibacter sp.]|uniref:hypothetical protein n=1 Tax=Craterilacuibacter sp. TaxID=2870909 RepID=UPI003F3DCE88
MNAAKLIRKLVEDNKAPEQVAVLIQLAAALETGAAFDVRSLYDIDMKYFDIAIQLLQDWRFDHHIAARSKLIEEIMAAERPAE